MKPKISTKKQPAADKIKKIGKQQVTLTNQDKLYFPDDDITKGDVIDYYQKIAKFILPHLKNRPQSLNRFPNGIKGLVFIRKMQMNTHRIGSHYRKYSLKVMINTLIILFVMIRKHWLI
jgi:hypothetical protein